MEMENCAGDIDTILKKIEERNLTHIHLVYFDHNGRLRGKYYHAGTVRKALLEGTAINLGIFSTSPDEIPMTNSAFFDPQNQFRDGVLRLDAKSCREFPLGGAECSLLLIGELVDEFAAYCCRSLLRSELHQLGIHNLVPYGAFEFEWYLLEETMESIRVKSPAELTVHTGFEVFYSFVDQIVENTLFRELLETCERMGLPLATLHTEYSTLMEGALRPVRGLTIADNAALFKTITKIIMRKNGLMASFMARRNNIDQGCGAHINLSLMDTAGHSCVFYDPERKDKISVTLRHFLGGLQKYTPELFLLHCPHINSYRRLQSGLFSPLSNTWGIDNKTTAYRVVNVNPGAARLEVRLPGADVNPYLSLLGLLVAGRLGIEEKLDPTEPLVGDGWSASSPTGMEFPADFSTAMDRFDASPIARQALGDKFVDCFAASRRWQLETLLSTVTDWEVRTFIDGA